MELFSSDSTGSRTETSGLLSGPTHWRMAEVSDNKH